MTSLITLITIKETILEGLDSLELDLIDNKKVSKRLTTLVFFRLDSKISGITVDSLVETIMRGLRRCTY